MTFHSGVPRTATASRIYSVAGSMSKNPSSQGRWKPRRGHLRGWLVLVDAGRARPGPRGAARGSRTPLPFVNRVRPGCTVFAWSDPRFSALEPVRGPIQRISLSAAVIVLCRSWIGAFLSFRVCVTHVQCFSCILDKEDAGVRTVLLPCFPRLFAVSGSA